MIKVAAIADERTQVMQLADVYRARIVDVSPEALVIEVTGTEEKVDSLVEMLRPYRIVEMVRTGRVTISRGSGPVRGDRRRAASGVDAGAVDEASGSV
jgi:acetolactate synthase-1/3 small subunit